MENITSSTSGSGCTRGFFPFFSAYPRQYIYIWKRTPAHQECRPSWAFPGASSPSEHPERRQHKLYEDFASSRASLLAAFSSSCWAFAVVSASAFTHEFIYAENGLLQPAAQSRLQSGQILHAKQSPCSGSQSCIGRLSSSSLHSSFMAYTKRQGHILGIGQPCSASLHPPCSPAAAQP